MRHPRSGKILSCGTYQHPHGIEVRSGYQQETDLLWSQLVKSPDAASELAAEWKAMVLGKGFEEVME